MSKSQDPFLQGVFSLGVLVVVGMALGVGARYVDAWKEPTSPPPGGNVAAPINIGNIHQDKVGSIGVNGYVSTNDAYYFNARSGTGTWAWYSPTPGESRLWKSGSGDRLNIYDDGHAILARSTNDADAGRAVVTKDYLLSKIGGGGITGTGTTNTLPLWTGASTLGNSIVNQSGSQLNVNGTLSASGNIVADGDRGRLYFQGGEGEVLRLTGNNGTKMHLQSLNGVFRLVNSPWSAQLFSVDQSGNTAIQGNLSMGSLLSTSGRMHISGGELLYLLNRNGVIISKAWGGNGNLIIEGKGYMYDQTAATDPAYTLVTKGYVDAAAGGGQIIQYVRSSRFTFVCNGTVQSTGYVQCPAGTYVVGCARDNENNFGSDDDWVTDKDGAFNGGDWVNVNLIPPGSRGYGGGSVMSQGGCRIGYNCSNPISYDGQYIRAVCAPASNYIKQ